MDYIAPLDGAVYQHLGKLPLLSCRHPTMTDSNISTQFEAFVVRFWLEQASGVWRGKAIHIHTRQVCDFATLEQVEAFFRQFVPVLPDDQTRDVSEREAFR